MKPSDILKAKSSLIRATIMRYRTTNPRVFGSVVYGTDKEESDIDLLVDALPGTTLFDLGGLQDELETVLSARVDLLTPADLPAKFRAKVLSEAQPI